MHPPMGGGVSTIINLQTELNYLDYVKIYQIVRDLTWPTDWPTNHPHTHPWVGVSLQIINLQTELNYLNYVKIY